MYKEIDITKEELLKIIYFILMKYESDPLHMQGTSSKRDLLGGFIERWMNKLAETAIFDHLLSDRPYEAVSDYFLYDNASDKNAPDILGIKADEKITPFVQYNDGTWEVVSERPRVEVKTVRIDQYLIGIREPQMIDDFYVFVESNLSPDYLTMIFEEDVFNDDFLQKLKMDDIFIKSDKNSSIISPELPKRADVVGSFRLIGTYTKDQIKNNTLLCGPKVSPRYVKSVENVESVRGENMKEKLNVADGKFTYNHNDSIYLPMAIDGDLDKVNIVKANKGSVYLKTEEPLIINGDRVDRGYVRIELPSFDRSSNWDENLAIKKSFEIFTNDSTEEMLASFDQVYKSNL